MKRVRASTTPDEREKPAGVPADSATSSLMPRSAHGPRGGAPGTEGMATALGGEPRAIAAAAVAAPAARTADALCFISITLGRRVIARARDYVNWSHGGVGWGARHVVAPGRDSGVGPV